MITKTAALIGAYGLVGSAILKRLISDESYSKIYLIVRRPILMDNPKVEVIIVNFNNHDQFRAKFPTCDVLFCAVGTTMKQMKGDKDAYKKVDFDIPVHAAEYALEKGCHQFLIVSSLGADSTKSNFYLQLKGKVEDTLHQMNIPTLHIFRPSLLTGKRNETRFGEVLAAIIMKPLSFLLPKKMRPIRGREVAKAMVNAANLDKKGKFIHHYDEMKCLNEVEMRCASEVELELNS